MKLISLTALILLSLTVYSKICGTTKDCPSKKKVHMKNEYKVIKHGEQVPKGFVAARWKEVLKPYFIKSGQKKNFSYKGNGDFYHEVTRELYIYKNEYAIVKVENGSVDGPGYHFRWRLHDNNPNRTNLRLYVKIPKHKIEYFPYLCIRGKVATKKHHPGFCVLQKEPIDITKQKLPSSNSSKPSSNSSNSKKKLVFIKSRRTCYTTKQCQNWRKGSKSPLWKECFCSKGKGHSRGYCKFAKDLDAVSDLVQEKTYDQLLGYHRVDLAIVLGFGGILGAVGAYLFNKEGNNAKF